MYMSTRRRQICRSEDHRVSSGNGTNGVPGLDQRIPIVRSQVPPMTSEALESKLLAKELDSGIQGRHRDSFIQMC